jgi:hypothetical protein
MSLNVTTIVWDELPVTGEPTPETSYNFTTDPLLVSCTLYRLIKESRENNSISCLNWSLTSHMDKIAAKITDEDRTFSESLRSYYKSKLLVAKLRGDHFSDYRTTLLKYLTDSPMKITERSVGMIYRLPYFFQYDMQLIEIFGGEYTNLGSTPKYVDRTDVELSFIAKADSGQKRKRTYEFWFKDDSGIRFLLEVEKHNPIMNLWEQTIKSEKMSINAVFERKTKGNLEFYIARGWSINV